MSLSDEQQIEELNKIVSRYIDETVTISKMIDETERKIEELKKPKKWKPKADGYKIVIDPIGFIKPGPCGFKTQQMAIKAAGTLIKSLKILAYIDEFGGDWVADWDNNQQLKYYVYFDRRCSKWSKSCRSCKDNFGNYMSKKCAKGLVIKLNSGEVVL